MIIDFAEGKGEGEATDDIAKRVHVRKNAAGAGERDGDNHEKFEDDAGGLRFDVMRQNDGGHEENGGDDHDVSGREGWFAGAVGASGEDENVVKDQVGDCH